MALQNARDVYTRRGEAASIWVVRSSNIIATNPADKDVNFSPSDPERKPYRHPTFYKVPTEVGHM
jgi:ring-1,2-phenylacetyl-CoA epoxidase subunit PaaB